VVCGSRRRPSENAGGRDPPLALVSKYSVDTSDNISGAGPRSHGRCERSPATCRPSVAQCFLVGSMIRAIKVLMAPHEA
jgi:hypothetical protein